MKELPRGAREGAPPAPPVLVLVIEFDQQSGQVQVKGNIMTNKIVAAGMLQMGLQLVLGDRPPRPDVGLQIIRGGGLPPGEQVN